MIRTGRADVVVAGGTEAAIHPLPHRRVRQHDGDVQAQRRARAAPPAPTTRAATASSSARAPASSCWSRAEHAAAARRPGLRRGRPAQGITADAPPHRAARAGRAGAARARCSLAIADADLDAGRHRARQRARHLDAGRRRRRAQGAPRSVFGDDADHMAVSATKSMTGHLLGAAGAIESIATVLALHDRLAPPTINLDDPDDEVDARHRRGASRARCPRRRSPR